MRKKKKKGKQKETKQTEKLRKIVIISIQAQNPLLSFVIYCPLLIVIIPLEAEIFFESAVGSTGTTC